MIPVKILVMSRLTEIVGRAEDDRSVFLFFCRKISNTKEKKIIGAMEKRSNEKKNTCSDRT